MITFKKNSKNFQLFSPILFLKKEENIKNGNIITVLKIFGFVFSIYQPPLYVQCKLVNHRIYTFVCTCKLVNHMIYTFVCKLVNHMIYTFVCTCMLVNGKYKSKYFQYGYDVSYIQMCKSCDLPTYTYIQRCKSCDLPTYIVHTKV
jgi:hypothetical protein